MGDPDSIIEDFGNYVYIPPNCYFEVTIPLSNQDYIITIGLN